MRSLLNISLIGLMWFTTVSCGLLDNVRSTDDGTESTENSERDTTGDEQSSFETSEVVEGEESAIETDNKKVGASKTVAVRFAKGKTTRSYKSMVVLGATHTYSLAAAKGQKLSVSIKSTDSNAVFQVFSPVGKRLSDSDVGNKSFATNLAASGKYTIKVSSVRKPANYTVSFAASALKKEEEEETDPPRSGGVTRTVKFGKGKTSASYKNAVVRGDRDTYILGAKGGQQMSVSISALENNAVFQIRGPKGYLRGAGPGTDRKTWSGQLPADGKYRIIVGGTRGNATYTIRFNIR